MSTVLEWLTANGFIIERQGKHCVLYAGLLARAHELGLTGISTTLIQIPHETNYYVAICAATITLEDKAGKVVSFSGIGDASPKNVTPAMLNCTIRMAETRSKARALRDAINIGLVAAEEMSDDEDAAQPK